MIIIAMYLIVGLIGGLVLSRLFHGTWLWDQIREYLTLPTDDMMNKTIARDDTKERIKKYVRYCRIIAFFLPIITVGLFLGLHAWEHNANFFTDYTVRILDFSIPAWFFFTIVIIIWSIFWHITINKMESLALADLEKSQQR